MPITVVTPAASNANSYADVATADAYFATRPASYAATWLAEADDDVKAAALIAATQMLESRDWAGTKTDVLADNALRWPRTGVVNPDGEELDEDTVPADIENATAELAQAIMAGTVNSAGGEDTNFALEGVKVSSVEVTFDTSSKDREGEYQSAFTNVVEMLIAPYLAAGAAGISVPLTRA